MNSRRHGLTALVVTLVGLVIVGAGAALAWSWRDELPDPVASHWGRDGVDGFASLGSTLGLLGGVGGGLALLFGLLTWAFGQTGAIRRIVAAATIWITLFLTTVIVGSLYLQRGLADARSVGSIGPLLAVAIGGSLVVAIAVGFLVPGDRPQPTTEPVAADAPRVDLAAGSTWARRAVAPPVFYIAVPVLALALATAIWLRDWSTLIAPVVVVGALLALSAFDVRVDAGGLTARSVVGWPRLRVPLDEVVRADVIAVSPVRDFGGWGLRAGRNGALGIVLRSGEALSVTRTGGRATVITVDDAATAAGLLNALADRARA